MVHQFVREQNEGHRTARDLFEPREITETTVVQEKRGVVSIHRGGMKFDCWILSRIYRGVRITMLSRPPGTQLLWRADQVA